MKQDILQKYKQYVHGQHAKHNTRHTYLEHIRVMFEHIDKPYHQITQDDLDKYITYCQENRKQNGNAIRFWSIRQFITWTQRTDLTVPKVSPVDAGKLAINPAETQKILDTIEKLTPLHRLVFYLEYDTIRRPDEIRKLRINDRYQDILAYDGKTGRKKAFMTRRLIQAWDDYTTHERPLPANETEAQYLILSNYGQYKGYHYRYHRHIDRIIKEICMYSQVQLPQGQTPSNYLIKRTSITNQLKTCPDPKIIQTQAGHTKLQTTMKYNRLDDDHIRIYLESFEDKSQLFKPKKEIDTDKSFISRWENPVDSLNKSDDGETNMVDGHWSFTISFSFEQHNCPLCDDEPVFLDLPPIFCLYGSSSHPYTITVTGNNMEYGSVTGFTDRVSVTSPFIDHTPPSIMNHQGSICISLPSFFYQPGGSLPIYINISTWDQIPSEGNVLTQNGSYLGTDPSKPYHIYYGDIQPQNNIVYPRKYCIQFFLKDNCGWTHKDSVADRNQKGIPDQLFLNGGSCISPIVGFDWYPHNPYICCTEEDNHNNIQHCMLQNYINHRRQSSKSNENERSAKQEKVKSVEIAKSSYVKLCYVFSFSLINIFLILSSLIVYKSFDIHNVMLCYLWRCVFF